MPLIHLYVREGMPSEKLECISEVLHQALLDAWEIPLDDQFQVIHELKVEHMKINRKMWNINRSEDVILFHIFTTPRTLSMKKSFYQKLCDNLASKVQMRKEDVFVSISSNHAEDWSFGNGEAQILTS